MTIHNQTTHGVQMSATKAKRIARNYRIFAAMNQRCGASGESNALRLLSAASDYDRLADILGAVNSLNAPSPRKAWPKSKNPRAIASPNPTPCYGVVR